MNSFGSRSKLRAGNQEYEIYRLMRWKSMIAPRNVSPSL